MTCSCGIDFDECKVSDSICGHGTCWNLPNGRYYYCDCEEGYQQTGDPCTLSRTCTGMTRSCTCTLNPAMSIHRRIASQMRRIVVRKVGTAVRKRKEDLKKVGVALPNVVKEQVVLLI